MGSQIPNCFEMMSRSKRKKWTCRVPGTLVLYVILFCMYPGIANAQERAASEEITLFVDENQPPGTVVGTVAGESRTSSNSYSFLSSTPPQEFHLNRTTGIITTTVRIDRESLSNDLFQLPVTISSEDSPDEIIELSIAVNDLNDNSPVFPQPVISVSFQESVNIGTVQILPSAMDADKDINGYVNAYTIEDGNENNVFRLQTFRPRDDAEYTISLVTTMRLDRETVDFYVLNISATDNSSIPRTGYFIVNVTITDFNDNAPAFTQTSYQARVNESADVGSFVFRLEASDQDIGSNGDIVYGLKSGLSNDFAVDPESGNITLRRRLPYTPSGYSFTVTATDRGASPLSSQAFVTVEIEDENDHSPLIEVQNNPKTEESSILSITEAGGPTPQSLVNILFLKGSDEDSGDNGLVSMTIFSGNERSDFDYQIFSVTGDGYLSLSGSQTANIDREVTSSYNLTFKAEDAGTPPRVTYRSIIINVVDENDHAPVFLLESYHASLNESVLIGSFVESVTARDADEGVNADIVYSISGDDYGWFQIDNDTGLVTTRAELDHERAAQVTLTIIASDQGLEPMTNSTMLTIDILDVNDEFPVFNLTTLSEIVEENSPPTDLVQVMATDADGGAYGDVMYALASPQYATLFSLDPASGMLSTIAFLDREERETYELKIIAYDGGVPPLQSTATVTITITDQNDNDPQFYPLEYFANVIENAPAGVFVTIVSARDLDAGANSVISYSIANSSRFQIDSTFGNITTTESLDREVESSYTLTVNAQDGNGRMSPQPAIVHILVTDTLDNPLEFEQNPYRFQVEENRHDSTIIGTVKAKSLDLNVDITYAIINGNRDGLFGIDFYSGVINSTRSIDRETQESNVLQLTVLAVDGSQNGQTIVEVEILDINDNAPVFSVEQDQVDVVENWAVGYEFYVADVTDADSPPNNLILYELSVNNDNRFGINHTSGVLFINIDLQNFPEKEYNLQIKATDYGTPPLSSTLDLVVNVRDVNNNAPIFADSINTTLKLTESIPVNTRFIQPVATDADEGTNGEITYHITSGNTEDSFGIFPDGVVYVKRSLDREQVDYYQLTIEAKDGGVPSLSSSLTLEITILDENDNRPFFDNATYNFYLSEEEEVGARVGIIHAVDNDEGRNGELTYSFTTNQTYFALDSLYGIITSKVILDRESLLDAGQASVFSARVRVRDNGQTQLQDNVDVNIHIVDINDNAPIFDRENYQASVSELARNETLIIRVSASDDDVGDNSYIIYSIVSGNEDERFHIHHTSGQIKLIAGLDREETDHYTVRVKALDGGSPPQESFADVEITILDENDHRPTFQNKVTQIEVTECLRIGEDIGFVNATDVDINSNGRISYTIIDGNVGGIFGVNPSTGIVYLTGLLDHEATSQYVLNISARDGGSPSLVAAASLVINVRDCNDNSPIFAYVGVPEMDEEEQVGYPVVRVQASDADSGVNGEIRFSISSQQPAGDFFAIDPESGWITTTTRINRESAVMATDQFLLTIHATDLAVPVESRRTASVEVVIFVRDINDNAPVFNTQQAIILPRNTAVNNRVTTIDANDPDAGVNGQVTYTLVTNSVPFRLDLSLGELTLRQSIGSSNNLYSLEIQAQDAGNPQRTSTFILTIIVSDGQSMSSGLVYNENAYTGSVGENRPAETDIVTVVAGYSDGRTASVRYYVGDVRAGGVTKGSLIVADPTSGIIRTGAILDREDLNGGSTLVATVYAVDTSSSSSQLRSVQVTITVIDENDNAPVFGNGPYNVSITENSPTNSLVTTVMATDADLDTILSYSISSGATNLFSIDSTTGEVRTQGDIDRESSAVYQLVVEASDGTLSSSTMLDVHLLDVNDNDPDFTMSAYSFLVAEDEMVGEDVGTVEATDPDAGPSGEVVYSVVEEGAPGEDVFFLDSRTGTFRLLQLLDYEMKQHYILTVMATDQGASPRSSTALVYINVDDVNDNDPVFSPNEYSAEVPEDVAIGTSVVTLTASDLDSGLNGELEFTIASGDSSQRFMVYPNGTLATIKALDREEETFYNLEIVASDMNPDAANRRSSTAQVSIIVTDINDNAPRFTSPDSVEIAEDTRANVIIMVLRAEDDDVERNSYVEYYLLTTGVPFAVSRNEGNLQVTGALDREQDESYTLLVQATDKGSSPQSSTMNVTVYITDINDNAPTFDPASYTATLDEDTPIGLEFLKVVSTDPDEGLNSIIRYSIFSGDSSGAFSIDSFTGVISVNSALDYERRSAYSLTIRAQDQGYTTQFSSVTVTIDITDINDNSPVFGDSYGPSITENNLPNADVVQVSAQDDDDTLNGLVSYRLAMDYNGLFTIDSTDGQIRVTESLDYETENEYELVVIAEDAGIPMHQATTTMTLRVDDDNDHDPVFVSDYYRATISEHASPDTFVVQVTASDIDVTADLRYQLNDDVGTKFTIDPLGGRIITSGVLDREVQESYLLNVTVRDGPSRQVSTSVYVEVLDVNDNPPFYSSSSYTALLPATSQLGRFVAAVQASDADLGDNAVIGYSISSGDSSKFTIDSTTGDVFTARSLSNENGVYNLQITAQDVAGGQNSVSASLRVEFSTGVFPVISSPTSGMSVSYSENVPTGGTVATVVASGSVMYSIVGGNYGDHFSVGSQSGVVSIIKKFDYETRESFSLWIEAANGNNPPFTDHVELQITITDVNDNAPIFDQTVYFASVTEEQSGQVQVVTVSASDADSQDNGEVSYSIVAGNTNDVFDISSFGVITTISPLNRETVASYLLTVVATDGGSPAKSGSAIVVITVGDVNDNGMAFVRTSYEATIPENAPPGTHIVTVHTTDPDENNLSQFSIAAGGSSFLFAIDSVTGELTLNGSLDYEDERVRYIYVNAQDPQASQNIAQVQVTINIEDVNDNAPVFSEDLIERTFPELYFSSGGILASFSATDADDGENGQIEYVLKTLTDHFRVETNLGRGWIYAIPPISYIVPSPEDTSDPNEYVFSVFAVDLGTPALYDEVAVIMHVIPDNSHTPVFEESSYFSPVTQDTRTNTRILQVVAVDQDTGTNADITYSVAEGNGTSRFDIEANSGWIITRNVPLAADVGNFYQLIIKATDQGHIRKEANTTVTLLITDSNVYAPVFDDDTYSATVAEDVVQGMIITVYATDDDDGINGEIRYSITGNDADLFNIDATSGVVTLAGSLDREMADEHQVQVIAEDQAMYPQTAVATLRVIVTDVDDNPPVFKPKQYSAEVYENTPSATSVVTVVATDVDEGANAEFEYVITGGDGTDYFTISGNTGLILTQGNLDYETGKTTYLLTVAAVNEDGTMVDYAHVTVTLLGRNEFYPQFPRHQYDFYVNEHAADGDPVGMVLAFDSDLGDDSTVNYLLIGGSNSQGFAIDLKSGMITVAYQNGILDRETADTITLSVLAKNEGPINGDDIDEAEVTVHITDGNDAPVFPSQQYQAKVLENAAIGSDVTVVTATDYDLEPSFRQFNYSIIDGNQGTAFQVDARSGRITTANSLDRETIAVYFLTIAAIDSGNPPQTGTTIVSVELEDINDNGPVFVGDAAEGAVLENEPSNEPVMTLHATDPDEGSDPTRFTYMLLTTPDSLAFRLVGDQLETTQTLDREAKSDYYLQIQASDGESPALTAVSTIHIAVVDRNDNPSTARQARIEVKMYQSIFTGGNIGSARPIDPDTNDVFSCAIQSGDTSKFSIVQNCQLFSGAQTTETQLNIDVSGSDGSHQTVTSTFNVVYESFTNDTITNSVTLRLADIDAETFLSQSYDRFRTSLSAFLSSRETLIVLSITDHPDISKVDMVLAIKKQGGQHLLRADLVDLLTSNEATLESQSDITIETIDYTACSDSPCLNSGVCSDETKISLEGLITESDPVILVGLQTSHTFTCSCPPEFSGQMCEIPTNYCESSACANGATCQNGVGGYTCICTPGFTGDLCGTEINECSSNPCINGASCQDLTNSFYCDCPNGYSGIFCEIGPCSTNPCENGGTCTESGSNFVCQCDNNHWGDRCQYDTIGFEGGSYISRSALSSSGAVILLEFSTISTKALLFYNHDSFTSNNARFVALEILNGRLQLGFNFGTGQGSLSTSKIISDGSWHRVEVRLQVMSIDLNILDEDCPRLTIDACRATQDMTGSMEFDNNPLTFGGVSDISEITSRPLQVSAADFVGCMNSIYVNGERLSVGNALGYSNLVEGCSREEGGTCEETSCPQGTTCVDEWWSSWCDCDPQVVGSPCAEGYNSVSFGGGGRVEYRIKEDYKRQALLEEAKEALERRRKRRRRATGSESVNLSFRTGTKHGLLLHITSDSEFTILQLKNGSVVYIYGSDSGTTGEITVMASSSLTDWAWHNVTLTSIGSQVTLQVDGAQKSATFADPHEFTGLALTGMSLGGTETPLVIDGQRIQGFAGCLDGFEMNGEALPLDGDTARFEAVPSANGDGCSAASLCAVDPCNQGETCVPTDDYYVCVPFTCSQDICQNGGSCSDNAGMVMCECSSGFSGTYCETEAEPIKGGGINVVWIIVPIIIVLLVVVCVLAAVYCLRRRSVNLKNKQAGQDPSLRDPKISALGAAENQGFLGDTFDDATMIGTDGKVNMSGLMQRQTPDIIEQNMGLQINNSNPSSNSLMMENDTGEHVNIEMEIRSRHVIDEAEHYDLENASSIAASDMDVAYHYKHYHDRDRNRRRKKHRPNQNPMLARIQASPARLSPVSMGSRHSPNPMVDQLVHSTPLDSQNPLLRVSPGLHSNYSTKDTMRIGSVPNSGRATPARNIGSPVNSDRSYQSELRSQAHRSDVSSLRSGGKPSRVTTPLSHEGKSRSRSKGRTSKSPLVVGLTAEEVAQLNTARPDLMTGSQASTMDDLSSNGSRGHHPHHDDHTPVDPSRLLEPPDSTSDDTNDSFTCSEMESEFSKRRDYTSTESAILSRLHEIEHAEDSVLPHVNGALKQKRLDSRGNSLSTLHTSEEENANPQNEKTDHDVTLERLLGWGPRFDNLVEVFKDIAQLHENTGKINLQASLTHEEFV